MISDKARDNFDKKISKNIELVQELSSDECFQEQQKNSVDQHSEKVVRDIDKQDEKIVCDNIDKKNERIVHDLKDQHGEKIVHDIDKKDERIIELETELLQLKEFERNNFLRLKAEIENVRRRSEQDVERAHKFALEHFFIELLPVIDNLERALNMIDRSNNIFFSTIEGIELTLKSLLDTVDKFGLKVIDEVNISFDPLLHQAMSILESKEHQSNCIISVMQKGYSLNGRLIRPAMVTVAK